MGMRLESDLMTFGFLSAPVISPANLAGYGGRNGEIVITWTVMVPTPKKPKIRQIQIFFLFYS